jgi:hypothetical protein
MAILPMSSDFASELFARWMLSSGFLLFYLLTPLHSLWACFCSSRDFIPILTVATAERSTLWLVLAELSILGSSS